MSKLPFVFVYGLSGWGSYDARYQMSYLGMPGGLTHRHDIRVFYSKLLGMIEGL